MKKMGNEAVSPVIAVILMVAITVVLAATVFVLVADIGGPTNVPRVSFNADESRNELLVVSADTGHAWAEFTVTGCTAPAGNVTAGQVLVCQPGQVSVTHNPSNSLVYRAVFT